MNVVLMLIFKTEISDCCFQNIKILVLVIILKRSVDMYSKKKNYWL